MTNTVTVMVEIIFLFFRNCSEIQKLFLNLANAMTEEIMHGQGLMNWIRSLDIDSCKTDAAWEGRGNSTHTHYWCSLHFVRNHLSIIKNDDLTEIVEISKLHESAIAQLSEEIWSSFEGKTSQQLQSESKYLEGTIGKIKKLRKESDSIIKTKEIDCSLNWNCAKAFRKIVLQMKLIQLGYYGGFETTAGLFLAKHRGRLGTYFTNSKQNQWPNQPLHRGPNRFELLLNELMENLTEILSNQTHDKQAQLHKVSLLDLSAFGSMVSNLKELQEDTANWPIEVNFAVFQRYNQTELTKVFRKYRYLIKLWKLYMDEIHSPIKPENSSYPLNVVIDEVIVKQGLYLSYQNSVALKPYCLIFMALLIIYFICKYKSFTILIVK